MAVELHTSGPGLEDRRLVIEGEAELVLGRDADCGICLPDPRRNVSRRHLAVWCVADELHFRVVSVVNGVDLPFGEAPPGARGVLPHGQMLRLGDYRLLSSAVAAQQTPASVDEDDPWAALERESSGFGGAPAGQPASMAAAPASPDEDPFGDWGFDSGFGAEADAPPATGGSAAAGSGAGLDAFFRGAGLDPQQLGALSTGELEEAGKLVRMALLGLLTLHASKAELKRDLRAEDRTMLATADNNPLKADGPDEARLRYLLGGRSASMGFIRPERALGELLQELHRHDLAMAVAARAVVEGTLRDLAPAALKTTLPAGGGLLFGGARLWDAYVKLHEERGADLPGWLQQLFGKYFTQAYMRETQRLKREPPTRPRGADKPRS